MHPPGGRSHHAWDDFWSKSVLPGCQTLGEHLVVRLFLHILCLYDMHSWRWPINPLSPLRGSIGTYCHCQLQWQWHHLLMMYPLMVVNFRHWHLESWPWCDEILVFWQGTLTTLSLLHVVLCSGQLAVICHLGLTVCLHWHRCFLSDYHHLCHFHSSGRGNLLLYCVHHWHAWWCSWSGRGTPTIGLVCLIGSFGSRSIRDPYSQLLMEIWMLIRTSWTMAVRIFKSEEVKLEY